MTDSLPYQEVDRILWEVWDPIGVNDMPEARDEYRRYVKPILLLMRSGASDAMLAQHLLRLATEEMGLSGTKYDDMLPTVNALRQVTL